MMDQVNLTSDNIFLSAFKAIDLDNNGYIERKELAKVFEFKELRDQVRKSGHDDKDVERMCDELDKDGDGRIDFTEFAEMVKDWTGGDRPKANDSPKASEPKRRSPTACEPKKRSSTERNSSRGK